MTRTERIDVRQEPSITDNPYWDVVKTIDGRDWRGHWAPDSYPISKLLAATTPEQKGAALREFEDGPSRSNLVKKYAWAIPDPRTLRFVWEHALTSVVEMGAGNGYWAWQLSQLGVKVRAYDKYPPHKTVNFYFHPKVEWGDLDEEHLNTFFLVEEGDHTVLETRDDSTLLLVWPPYNSSMGVRMLRSFRGQRVIYIGEGEGGCTGDDEFHRVLSEEWETVAWHTPVQWDGLHDHVTVYDRKTS